MRHGKAGLLCDVFKSWRRRSDTHLSGAGDGQKDAQTKRTDFAHERYPFYRYWQCGYTLNFASINRLKRRITRKFPALLYQLLVVLVLGPPVVSTGQAAPKSSRPPGFQFVDVTNASKIRFEHVTSLDKKYLIESMSGGVL